MCTQTHTDSACNMCTYCTGTIFTIQTVELMCVCVCECVSYTVWSSERKANGMSDFPKKWLAEGREKENLSLTSISKQSVGNTVIVNT